MTQEPRSTSNITEELTRLGNQVADALRLAWESDERKRIQSEIAEGVKNVSVQVDEAVRKASETETARKVKTQAEQVAAKARESDVVDDMREGLLVGLQTINRELSKLLVRLENNQSPTATTTAVPPAAPDATEPPAGPTIEI